MADVHALDRLFAVIQSRKGADPETSYTARLFSQGTLKIAKKLGEESIETALAAVAQGPDALAAESADLLYHLLVLWAACDIEPADVYRALEARSQRSGLEEKTSR
jgi:phosphoribosyl-ATP pyrophosphohydrolase